MTAQLMVVSPDQAPHGLRFRFGAALIRHLTEAASVATDVAYAAICGPSRVRHLAYIRFAIMLVAREHGKTFPAIARDMGRVDHTSVMHGVKQARRLELEDVAFASLVAFLRKEAERVDHSPCIGRKG